MGELLGRVPKVGGARDGEKVCRFYFQVGAEEKGGLELGQMDRGRRGRRGLICGGRTTQALINAALEQFAIPGDAGFPLNQAFEAPKDRQDAEVLRQYVSLRAKQGGIYAEAD